MSQGARIVDARRLTAEARVPVWILRSEEFAVLIRKSPLAAHILLLLQSYADREELAWCSQRRLAKLAGTHRRTVQEALAVLIALSWLKKEGERRGPNNERQADLYRMCLPPALEAVRDAINARLAGKPVPGGIPYVRDDDVFQGRTQLFQRMARVPQTALGSLEWTRLRASGQAMHVYLLLCCYAPSRERVGGKRIAAETHMALPRVREAIRALGEEDDRWVTIEKTILASGGHGASAYVLEHRLFTPAAALDDDGEFDDTIPDAPPPADLVEKLPGPVKQAVHAGELDELQVWELLRSNRLWPRPALPLDVQARRLVRDFQTLTRDGQDMSLYQPSVAEMAFARELFSAFGDNTYPVVRQMLKLSNFWKATNFAGLSTWALQAARQLNVEPKIKLSTAPRSFGDQSRIARGK